MTKFKGKVGYVTATETIPGRWRNVSVERTYSGEFVKNTSKWRPGEGLNDNVVLENRLSIIADPYAYENYSSLRYIKWMRALWKITSVDEQRPRLILTIGGVYNGEDLDVTGNP